MAPAHPPIIPYRKDIQILRGLAVLLVVLFHLGLNGFQDGFLGVDIFFVISGFLMAQLYNPRHKKHFFMQRALRLLPAYFTVILITTFFISMSVLPSESAPFLKQLIYANLFLANVGYWLQNSYFSKLEFNPLLHLWSLGVEIQYYLMIPILFGFLKEQQPWRVWIIGCAALVACWMLLFISPKTAFFMLPFRLWEFLIGYLAAYYAPTPFSSTTSRRLGTFLLGLMPIGIILAGLTSAINGDALSVIHGHPGLIALLVTFATGLILVFSLQPQLENSVAGRGLEMLGHYSYSIYLVHYPIIVLFLYQPFSGTRLKPDTLLEGMFLSGLIALSAYLLYQWIEIPCKKNLILLRFYMGYPWQSA